MYAIIDEQGTVWGLGETSQLAWDDASNWRSELTTRESATTSFETVEVTPRQADAIRDGVVAWSELQAL